MPLILYTKKKRKKIPIYWLFFHMGWSESFCFKTCTILSRNHNDSNNNHNNSNVNNLLCRFDVKNIDIPMINDQKAYWGRSFKIYNYSINDLCNH